MGRGEAPSGTLSWRAKSINSAAQDFHGTRHLSTLATPGSRNHVRPARGGLWVGTSTVYRYISEAVDLLAALAPTLDEAVRAASTKAYVLLDGTLLPIDRTAADRPFYSGKHKTSFLLAPVGRQGCLVIAV